jgi:hypothetical protein
LAGTENEDVSVVAIKHKNLADSEALIDEGKPKSDISRICGRPKNHFA